MKYTRKFEQFSDEVLHAICLSHDRHVKKHDPSCGFCGTEDCTCSGHNGECDCNLCQSVYEIETKQTDGFLSYKNYSQVFYAFMEFPTFGFKKGEYNTAGDFEEFSEQIESHILFLKEIKGILKRHLADTENY